MKRLILHLCADIGSDSHYYQLDEHYEVLRVGADPGVENFHTPRCVHGIIANPVCTEFSTARGFHKRGDTDAGFEMVKHCQRIIAQAHPAWWVIENPANGLLSEYLGKPTATYQPWEYGSPWTKRTALWGKFRMPLKRYYFWEDVPKNDKLYVRPGRPKPALAFLHKSAALDIPEFAWALPFIHTDADLRSMCSAGFAFNFYKANP